MPRLTITSHPTRQPNSTTLAHAQQPEVRRRAQIIRPPRGLHPTTWPGTGISRKTVYNVTHTFELHGIDGLYDRRRSGRPGRADDDYRTVLEETLALFPRDLGYSNMGWTATYQGTHGPRNGGHPQPSTVSRNYSMTWDTSTSASPLRHPPAAVQAREPGRTSRLETHAAGAGRDPA